MCKYERVILKISKIIGLTWFFGIGIHWLIWYTPIALVLEEMMDIIVFNIIALFYS